MSSEFPYGELVPACFGFFFFVGGEEQALERFKCMMTFSCIVGRFIVFIKAGEHTLLFGYVRAFAFIRTSFFLCVSFFLSARLLKDFSKLFLVR